MTAVTGYRYRARDTTTTATLPAAPRPPATTPAPRAVGDPGRRRSTIDPTTTTGARRALRATPTRRPTRADVTRAGAELDAAALAGATTDALAARLYATVWPRLDPATRDGMRRSPGWSHARRWLAALTDALRPVHADYLAALTVLRTPPAACAACLPHATCEPCLRMLRALWDARDAAATRIVDAVPAAAAAALTNPPPRRSPPATATRSPR